MGKVRTRKFLRSWRGWRSTEDPEAVPRVEAGVIQFEEALVWEAYARNVSDWPDLNWTATCRHRHPTREDAAECAFTAVQETHGHPWLRWRETVVVDDGGYDRQVH
jgi:hypothetical protein